VTCFLVADTNGTFFVKAHQTFSLPGLVPAYRVD
jgi:hypothetical protein